MQVAFTLSMPSNNAWNGKWSGAERLYVVVKNFGRTQKAERRARELLTRGSFGYNFGDGWRARIDVREVDTATARKLRKSSNGFCGYDWMIDRILQYGAILNDEEIAQQRAKPVNVFASPVGVRVTGEPSEVPESALDEVGKELAR